MPIGKCHLRATNSRLHDDPLAWDADGWEGLGVKRGEIRWYTTPTSRQIAASTGTGASSKIGANELNEKRAADILR